MKYISEHVFTDGDTYIDVYSFFAGMDYIIKTFDGLDDASNRSINVEKLQKYLHKTKRELIDKTKNEGEKTDVPMKKQMRC